MSPAPAPASGNDPRSLFVPSWAGGAPGALAGPFQEVWYLKLNDPAAQRALWLRITLLISGNGFRRVAETWGIFFQRGSQKEVSKTAVKQTQEIGAYRFDAQAPAVRVGECEIALDRTRGQIQSKGSSIQWDLAVARGHDEGFNHVPEALARAGLIKNRALTVGEDLRFTGKVTVNGESYEFKDAAGMLGHLAGPKNGHSWVWGHCNLFVDEQGKPVPFLFEGLSARARLAGPVPSPRLSAFFFHYQGKSYRFNTLWDAIRLQSKHTLTDWTFHAERGDLSFRGRARAELKDFAGLTYEDTNGSLLYCANSKLSDMEVHVYRRGKLESAFYSHGTAAFEVVSRTKNPYVPLLL